MLFVTNHIKMAANRRCAGDIQNEDEGESFIEQVSRAVRSKHIQKQPMIDLVVASIAIPLLVVFSLMLENSMRRDWIHDFEARWRILGLGLSLLFISLIVCLYVTHRLGFCIWAVHRQREINRVAEHRSRIPPLRSTRSVVKMPNLTVQEETHCTSMSHSITSLRNYTNKTQSLTGSRGNHMDYPAPLTSAGSQLHLVVRGELPPSYDSVVRNPDLPPPYFSVLICDGKTDETGRSDLTRPGFGSINVDVPGVHNQAPIG